MGLIGLTEKQYWQMIYLCRRRSGKSVSVATGKPEAPLTDKMRDLLLDLLGKHNRSGLTQGMRSYCETWLREQLYERRKSFSSKHTDKGNATEDDVIDLSSRILDIPMLKKNAGMPVVTEYIQGTCDVVEPGTFVLDAKSNYDCFTFPLWEDKMFRNYFLQLQCYGFLYQVPKLILFYGLVDMPEDMIEREARYEARKRGTVIDEEIHEEVRAMHTYSHLPDFLRARYWVFKYQPEIIEEVIERVKMCRQYIATLEKQLPLMEYETLTISQINAVCRAA